MGEDSVTGESAKGLDTEPLTAHRDRDIKSGAGIETGIPNLADRKRGTDADSVLVRGQLHARAVEEALLSLSSKP